MVIDPIEELKKNVEIIWLRYGGVKYLVPAEEANAYSNIHVLLRDNIMIPKKDLRPEVLAFALEMEQVLKIHDKRKEDSWKICKLLYLKKKLMEEVGEYCKTETSYELPDIANICMMLWNRRILPDGKNGLSLLGRNSSAFKQAMKKKVNWNKMFGGKKK